MAVERDFEKTAEARNRVIMRDPVFLSEISIPKALIGLRNQVLWVKQYFRRKYLADLNKPSSKIKR